MSDERRGEDERNRDDAATGAGSSPMPPPPGYPPPSTGGSAGWSGSAGTGQPGSSDPEQAHGQQQGYGQSPSYGQEQGYGEPPPYAQPPPYGQPSAYGQAGYPTGYGYGAPQTEGSAVWALVLAIGAWVVCPVVPAIIALALAGGAERAIAASGGTRTGDGLVKAARIISWIHLGFVALVVVVVLLVLTLAAASSTSERLRPPHLSAPIMHEWGSCARLWTTGCRDGTRPAFLTSQCWLVT